MVTLPVMLLKYVDMDLWIHVSYTVLGRARVREKLIVQFVGDEASEHQSRNELLKRAALWYENSHHT